MGFLISKTRTQEKIIEQAGAVLDALILEDRENKAAAQLLLREAVSDDEELPPEVDDADIPVAADEADAEDYPLQQMKLNFHPSADEE